MFIWKYIRNSRLTVGYFVHEYGSVDETLKLAVSLQFELVETSSKSTDCRVPKILQVLSFMSHDVFAELYYKKKRAST